ncbi:hypothetical protein ABT124_44960 [Streptomyces sp. NPDC001982]|uniref:hypothetical protein n=1 Tax=Streptomyces sp. NPDC001982 TaxID=3154405 RepID=UPI003317A917
MSWPQGPRRTASYDFHDVHGPVNAGNGQQYVADRDQTVYQADHGRLLSEVAALRQVLDGLRLTVEERQSAEGELRAVGDALDRDQPDRDGAARYLEAFTTRLRDAGVLASAGASVVGALSSIAHWLGPSAASVLALL